MIIVKIWGGIGNQLFQYVFGQYLHYRTKQEVLYDNGSFVSTDKLRNSELGALDARINFNNQCTFSRYRGIKNRILRLLFQINPKNHYIEETKTTIPSSFSTNHIYFFQGYWQSIDYYDWIKAQDSSFQIKAQSVPQELESIEREISASDNCISLHVRRGDYFTPRFVGIYGICDTQYFEKALEYLHNRIADAKVFVFSDDHEWVKKNIHISMSYTIVPNYDVPQFSYIELMSKCKHHIISNSSFSWWGAVLNADNDSITICPSRWRKDTDENPSLEHWVKM